MYFWSAQLAAGVAYIHSKEYLENCHFNHFKILACTQFGVHRLDVCLKTQSNKSKVRAVYEDFYTENYSQRPEATEHIFDI